MILCDSHVIGKVSYSEVNVAYGAADSTVEENDSYIVATDSEGTETMKKNLAYGAVLYQNKSAGDAIVDCGRV